MLRLGEFNDKLIVSQMCAPENKNVIWHDTIENILKEFINGEWIKSKNLSLPQDSDNYKIIHLNFSYHETFDSAQDPIKIGYFDMDNLGDELQSGKVIAISNSPSSSLVLDTSGYVSPYSIPNSQNRICIAFKDNVPTHYGFPDGTKRGDIVASIKGQCTFDCSFIDLIILK